MAIDSLWYFQTGNFLMITHSYFYALKTQKLNSSNFKSMVIICYWLRLTTFPSDVEKKITHKNGQLCNFFSHKENE